MRRIIFSIAIVVLVSMQSIGQQSSYYENSDFASTPASAMKFGLYGFDNPALLSTLNQPDLFFAFSDQYGGWKDLNRYGVFAAIPNFGFGMTYLSSNGFSVKDYRISFSGGDKTLSYGSGFGWSSGDKAHFNRENLYYFGVLYRPVKYISTGFTGYVPSKGKNEAVAEIAIRPFGDEKISLFGDYLISKQKSRNNWSAGLTIEAVPGIRLVGRYFESKSFSVGVNLGLGNIGFTSQRSFDKNNKYVNQTIGVRVGAYDRNPMALFANPKKYLSLEMIGKLKYQKFAFMDNSKTLISIISQINAAKNDPSVKGIALNLSGFSANHEMMWEIREKLADLKSSGKQVVIYFDRAGIREYHLASVADRIIIDPLGRLSLEGFAMGRNYYKGTLEKLGIGFDELRFYKYKSAFESFSEDKMTEGDREQRQKLVDDFYNLVKDDVTKSRNISPEEFDRLVNEEFIFIAADAKEKNLIDEIGRWDDLKNILKDEKGDEASFTDSKRLLQFKSPADNYWSEKPVVAVIYGIGGTSMDSDINARKLAKEIEAIGNDNNVKAIVFRADSPGGDAMAADFIAEALKKCKEKKPVIVSQGAVAGSGGYWISMYADTIVAAPNTITGSIGVISGWYYNLGIKESVGVSTDVVKRGERADLGYGMVIPFINLPIPDRKFSLEERAKVENLMKVLYKDFVAKVAAARNRTVEQIAEVAQGRVWSGTDGVKNGLVDVIGGLETAINIAREKAGLNKNEFKIVEYPDKGFFDFSSLMPKFFEINSEPNSFIETLKTRAQNNGKPMLLMPSDFDEIIYK